MNYINTINDINISDLIKNYNKSLVLKIEKIKRNIIFNSTTEKIKSKEINILKIKIVIKFLLLRMLMVFRCLPLLIQVTYMI